MPDTECAEDQFPIVGWDAIVWVVGNAVQAAYYLRSAFGMQAVAYSAPETGNDDHTAYLLQSGSVRLVVKGGTDPDSSWLDYHRRHGDGVFNLALEVGDLDRCIARARSCGAGILREPKKITDQHGTVHMAGISLYGEATHLVIDRSRYAGPYLPSFDACAGPEKPAADRPCLFDSVDHVGSIVEQGCAARWAEFYRRVMGFSADPEPSATGGTTVTSAGGRFRFVLTEPLCGRNSGADRFLVHHRGAGVQHVAFGTDDIVRAVDDMRARGVTFRPVPSSHYEDAARRARAFGVPLEKLRERHITVQWDESGYLLQAFTTPISDRQTVFLELVERHGATGVGMCR